MIFLNGSNIHLYESMFDHDVIIIAVKSDPNKHRCNNRISFYYIKDLVDLQEYILNVCHNDYESQPDLFSTLTFNGNVYVHGLQLVNRWDEGWFDMELCYWLTYNEPLNVKQSADVELYHSWYRTNTNITDIIPITILIPYYQTIAKQFEECIESIEVGRPLKFYTNILLKNFTLLENVDIPINRTEILEHFKIKVNSLHNNFKLFTVTGRPSNTSGGINLAALDKNSGQRKIIQVSKKENYLVEYDYDSFHVKIVAKIIGYNLPVGNLHEYFGRQYFNTPILTEEHYELSKQLTFKLLYGYGAVMTEYENIKFFKQVREYRATIWDQFNKEGYIEMPISKRKLKKENYEDITEHKLFNYILQGTETELNALRLEKILVYLYGKKSKLVLYTYDSFLFEYDSSDSTTFLDELREILNYGIFQTNIKIGKSYHKMVKYK